METKDLLSLSVRDFAAAVAAKTPTPGGGSVAGAVGALATALGEMAVNFTRGKKKFAQHEELYAHLVHRLEKTRSMFQDLVADDISAYSLYREAADMPVGPDKATAIQTALAAAINVPRMMTKLTLSLLEDLHGVVDKCNPYLISDLVAGAALAEAVAYLCHFNVIVNAIQLSDQQEAKDLVDAAQEDLDKARRVYEETLKGWSRQLTFEVVKKKEREEGR